MGGPTQRPPLSQHKGHKYPIPPLISTSVRQEATSQHSPHSVSSPHVPAPPPPKQKEEDWGGIGELSGHVACDSTQGIQQGSLQPGLQQQQVDVDL